MPISGPRAITPGAQPNYPMSHHSFRYKPGDQYHGSAGKHAGGGSAPSTPPFDPNAANFLNNLSISSTSPVQVTVPGQPAQTVTDPNQLNQLLKSFAGKTTTVTINGLQAQTAKDTGGLIKTTSNTLTIATNQKAQSTATIAPDPNNVNEFPAGKSQSTPVPDLNANPNGLGNLNDFIKKYGWIVVVVVLVIFVMRHK